MRKILATATTRGIAVPGVIVPARSRSLAGRNGSQSCAARSQSGSLLAGKVIGENSITKNTRIWLASRASMGGSSTASA
ncbi:hypothetical protein [Streptomyces sp. McG3]|uniref:hypothetical protein n=1 Tax=Streptomyces sp. McG3 TaxID=2725483 RepID=UPI002036D21E|nr:hypothetical protein [Streptomyces sp. McG3]